MAASDRPLRSQTWFKRIDNSGFEHRTHLKARGGLPELFDGRPVIGVANSASDLVPCNAHLTGARRLGEPRRAGERRLSTGVSDPFDRRFADAAERHALPQPDEHGARSAAARQPHRRRRAAHRLRQIPPPPT